MDNKLKKILHTLIFNITLFMILIIGIQNSSQKSKINLLLNQTIDLPISFIIGISFISGSVFSSFISLNSISKK